MRNGSQSQLSTKNTLKDGRWWRRCGGLLLGDHELWTGSSPSLDLRYGGAKARRGQKSVEPTCSHQHWHCTVKSGLQRAFLYIFYMLYMSGYVSAICHFAQYLVWEHFPSLTGLGAFAKPVYEAAAYIGQIWRRLKRGERGHKCKIWCKLSPSISFQFSMRGASIFCSQIWWNNLNLGYLVQQSSTEILKT